MSQLTNIISLLDHKTAGDKPSVTRPSFVPQMATCSIHGDYQENFLDSRGVERWVPDCPQCTKLRKVSSLLSRADIPARFLDCTFENYELSGDESQQRVFNQCRGYANNFGGYLESGTCLIMRGNPGTGKNHLVTAISRQLIAQGYSVLRVKAQDYLESYWAKGFDQRHDWLKSIAGIDLLILDELGRTPRTKGSEDAFFRLMDMRYEAVKPTAILSNLEQEQFKEELGDAAYDRLRQGGGKLVNFDWESYRGNAA